MFFDIFELFFSHNFQFMLSILAVFKSIFIDFSRFKSHFFVNFAIFVIFTRFLLKYDTFRRFFDIFRAFSTFFRQKRAFLRVGLIWFLDKGNERGAVGYRRQRVEFPGARSGVDNL